MDWDTYFINEAYLAACKSKDRRKQVGAIIVGPDHEIRSKGYNGPPRGVDDNDETIHEKPLKYSYFCHAEENAIVTCARIGVSAKGCTLYATFHPCANCARMIVQAGITEVVVHVEAPAITGWAESQSIAGDIFERCGVKVRRFSCTPIIRLNHQA